MQLEQPGADVMSMGRFRGAQILRFWWSVLPSLTVTSTYEVDVLVQAWPVDFDCDPNTWPDGSD